MRFPELGFYRTDRGHEIELDVAGRGYPRATCYTCADEDPDRTYTLIQWAWMTPQRWAQEWAEFEEAHGKVDMGSHSRQTPPDWGKKHA